MVIQSKIRKIIFIVLIFLFENEALAKDKIELSFPENSYYVKSKSYSSNPESEPPQYVHQLNKTKIESFKNVDWIDAGLAQRIRFEHRKNDYRRSINRTDNPFLLRTQAYFAVKNIFDPLRFTIEIQDSRRYRSEFTASVGDVNKLNLFQGYLELYFKNSFIQNREISLRAGRMAFEAMDRKLIARDDWGNSGTNFHGFRAIIGKKENDWQLDNFVLNPIVKKTDDPDEVNKNQLIYGSILHFRKFSHIATLQPFFFKLTQDQSSSASKRNINSPGLRFYGDVGDSGFDFDFIGIRQFGESDNKEFSAYAHATEIGYNYQHKTKPRLSLVYGYASGDKNPYDNKSQNFERFYGFNRPWSNNNAIEWQNLETIKSRLELQPSTKVRFEGSYSYYWLASATDSWKRADLQDKTGRSSTFIGRDFDFRSHYEITDNLRTTIGYAHFIPERFTKSVGRNQSSDFVYLEINLSLFGW